MRTGKAAMDPREFTYAAYAGFLGMIRDAGYAFVGYDAAERGVDLPARTCILRHDVDFDLDAARTMARKEAATLAGAGGATYFFLLNTEFYNLCSSKGREILAEMPRLGHAVGLHFDETRYAIGEDADAFVARIREELDLLSRLAEGPVTAVSMHRPSRFALEADLRIPGAVNSYGRRFFKDYKYLSDSRMHWREDPVRAVESGLHDRLHVLTHPFWFADRPESTRDKLLRFIRRGAPDRYDLVDGSFKDLREFVRREEAIWP